ncbi:CCNC-like protein, partial [Mya arenaria]
MSEEEYEKCMIFFANFIQALGEQLKVRQQVIATGTVNSLKCIDPWLMAPTCIFLASKVEEFGVISNSRLITTCQTVVKNKFSHAYPQEYPYRINNVLECEFYLLEMMDCCLVVYHPYRPLVQYVTDISSTDDTALHIACVIQQKDLKQWFAELSVDMDKILEITRQILHLYDLWKNYDEKKEIA